MKIRPGNTPRFRIIIFFTGCLLGCLPVCQAETTDEKAWQYGAYIDLGYANALQTGQEIAWRSKATTTRLNEFSPNMGMFYVRKLASENSRWGMELGGQAGYDTDGQVPAESRLPGYSILRYIARANVSYLAPIGNGLTFTAGLMNSFIGYESMYAKDNPNYTRSWIADYSPYYLIGAGAQYPINDAISLSFYLLSDYDYLAFRSSAPKYATQVTWTMDPHWKLTQNIFAGPEQESTDTRFWRYFSDTILQWSTDDISIAYVYDAGTEQLATAGGKQVLWIGSALFTRWHIDGPWSVSLRPEIYWDPDGRLTGSQQFIKAITTTVEYKIPLGEASLALRSEYRFDDSTGKQGGFIAPGNRTSGLAADQHLVLFSALLSFDSF